MDYERDRADQQQDVCHVYRAEADGTITFGADDYDKPNGLAFSPDEQFLYIADSGVTETKDGPKHI